MPVQTNARVRTIDTQGSTDDFNAPAVSDVVVDDTAVDAYYSEPRQRVTGLDGSNVVVWRELILDDRVPVDFREGQEVQWEYRGGTFTGTIQAVERTDLPTMPAHLRTIRLTLEPE